MVLWPLQTLRKQPLTGYNGLDGALAEQLRSGLQNRVDGCDSRRCLHFFA